MQRLSRSLVGLVLVATACGQATDDDAVQRDAERVVASAEAMVGAIAAPQPPSSLPEGCSIVTVIDNYGFETEIVECDDTSTPEPADPADPLSWLGSSEARLVSAQIRNGLVLHSACDPAGVAPDQVWDIDAATAALASAPEVLSAPLSGALRELDAAQARCRSDFEEWEGHMLAAMDSLLAFSAAVEELRS